jgi:Tfp pilus assembly protein PilF
VTAAPSAPQAAAPASAAQALYEDGFQLFKKKQFKEAEVFFRKCLAADPGLASCHMMLGTTYANLKQLEKGAHHYRRFLELAPNHPKAAAVRRHVEEYEKARSEAQ